MVCLQMSVYFLIKVLASKEKSFASGKKPLARSSQVKKTLCKWFASSSQTLRKLFVSKSTNANT